MSWGWGIFPNWEHVWARVLWVLFIVDEPAPRSVVVPSFDWEPEAPGARQRDRPP